MTIPLLLYGHVADGPPLFDEQVEIGTPNLAPEFLSALKERVGATMVPEDVFAYIYAVLFAPTYRSRYADFLKRDFPRVPLPRDSATMRELVKLGNRLVHLHLMRVSGDNEPSYPIAGTNCVDIVKFENGRVFINTEQYFDEVSQTVWEYHIGGYQVAQKWLKDRKGRLLTFDELHHYTRIIAAIDETISLQKQIDAAMSF